MAAVQPLTRHDVEQIALLARLALDDAEVEQMRADLTSILVHMDALAEVDTTGIEPMTHAVPMDLPLRPDEAAPSLPVAVALRGAPDPVDGLFQVPHVLEPAPRSGGS
jgi:aspartyl-tRNA(Asn)/glutamyl-tRNA(Gln) amidotransferase subunit C